MQFCGGIGGIFIMLGINTFFFGICWYMEGMLDDVIEMLRDLERIFHAIKKSQFPAKFHNVIAFHNTVIEYVWELLTSAFLEQNQTFHFLSAS